MVDGLDTLCEIIERHREEAEDLARLAPEVREAAGRAGLWVLAAPKEVGGLELPVPDQLAVFERVGAADPTVGWHALNTAATGLAAAWLPEADRREVFEQPDRPCGLSYVATAATLTAAEGGTFLLDGSWPFMTGCADARWCTVIARLEGLHEEGAVPTRRVVVRAADLEVDLTWDAASGMRGTGSHAIRACHVVVPASRVVDPAVPPLLDRTLFRWPSSSAIWGGAAALSVGVLRSAVAGAIELSARKVSRVDGHAHAGEPRVQQALTDATAAADALSFGLGHLARQMWTCYERGDRPPAELRARWWSLVFYTFDLVSEHVSRLYTTSSSAAYATRNRLDRALRDAHAISVAFESFQSLRRAAGLALLCQDPAHPLF